MKRIIITSILLSSILLLNAQVENIKISEKATLKTDFNLAQILELDKEKNEKTDKISGYRIQISANNNKFLVTEERKKAVEDIKNLKSYVIYDQPYYKLRLGDFRTRLDAIRNLQQVLDVFSSAFIVKDDIKVR